MVADPYPALGRLREEDPVHWSEMADALLGRPGENPALAQSAVEALLRYDEPTPAMVPVARKDVPFDGRVVRRGRLASRTDAPEWLDSVVFRGMRSLSVALG